MGGGRIQQECVGSSVSVCGQPEGMCRQEVVSAMVCVNDRTAVIMQHE